MLLLDRIDDYPLLDAATEVALAKRRAEGDEEARERLITSNLRLVVWVAKRYERPGVPLADLVQEGYFGLVEAVERFDWTRGHRFSTYATWWIRQRVQRAVDNQARVIRFPSHVAERMRRLDRVRGELRADLGREPTDEEVREAAGATVEEVRRIQNAPRTVVSLDAPIGDDGSDLGEMVAAAGVGVADGVEGDMGAETIREIVAALPDRQREVLVMRYGLDGEVPLTLEEIGARLGVSRERVRQIEQRALLTMSRRSEIQGLRLAG
ncbi:MAG TPA: sigma-70 family RNA polymerase sigma factor [Acidimicrobiia bacterium]|nr:sigma-70 family RNA polymerase sigma factor [Acidimicrobiia bacterium]